MEEANGRDDGFKTGAVSCAGPDGKLHKPIVTPALVQLLGLSCAAPGGVCVPSGAQDEAPKRLHPPGQTLCSPCHGQSTQSHVPNFGVWLAEPMSLGSSAGVHCPGILAPELPFTQCWCAADHGWGPPSQNHLPPAFCVPRDSHCSGVFPSWAPGQAGAHSPEPRI